MQYLRGGGRRCGHAATPGGASASVHRQGVEVVRVRESDA